MKYSKLNICTYTIHTAILFSYITGENIEEEEKRSSKQKIKIATICKVYKNGY